jgi:multiple sugar transport system permease protein
MARLRHWREHPLPFFAPALVLLATVTAYPIGYLVWLSLQRRSLIFADLSGFTGIGNYTRLLTDPRFWNALYNTVYFTAVSVAVELVLGLGMALLLSRPAAGRGLLRALMLIPWVIPSVVSARMWEWMFNVDYGVLNYLLGARIDWLGSPRWAIHAAIITDVWKMTPFVALLLLAGLQGIPADLYRAARVDGAGAWLIFRRITLPLLTPLILVVLIFRTIDAFRVFDAIYVLTGGGPGNSTETLSIYAYKVLFQTLQFGYGATLSMTVFVCVAAVTAVYARLLRRGTA